ncbi:recombination-associated protein RdgC, partial [Escherichia coli]|uniref:recombination-associated protein RdgC n=1 Tax=Escherichia coli TaxID=562 RepID=UPI00193AD2A3
MLSFKNLMFYRLSRDIELRAEEMEKQLAELTFTPCGSQDMAKTGRVTTMGSNSDAQTHMAVSSTHPRDHETPQNRASRCHLEKKKQQTH